MFALQAAQSAMLAIQFQNMGIGQIAIAIVVFAAVVALSLCRTSAVWNFHPGLGATGDLDLRGGRGGHPGNQVCTVAVAP